MKSRGDILPPEQLWSGLGYQQLYFYHLISSLPVVMCLICSTTLKSARSESA